MGLAAGPSWEEVEVGALAGPAELSDSSFSLVTAGAEASTLSTTRAEDGGRTELVYGVIGIGVRSRPATLTISPHPLSQSACELKT